MTPGPGVPVDALGRMVRAQPKVNLMTKLTNQQIAKLKQDAKAADPGPTITLTKAREMAANAGFGKAWFDQKHEGGAFGSATKRGAGWDFSEREVKEVIADAVIAGELRADAGPEGEEEDDG